LNGQWILFSTRRDGNKVPNERIVPSVPLLMQMMSVRHHWPESHCGRAGTAQEEMNHAKGFSLQCAAGKTERVWLQGKGGGPKQRQAVVLLPSWHSNMRRALRIAHSFSRFCSIAFTCFAF